MKRLDIEPRTRAVDMYSPTILKGDRISWDFLLTSPLYFQASKYLERRLIYRLQDWLLHALDGRDIEAEL